MTDHQAFRRAWGKFATGVAVITTIEPDGHIHGMAANGITSVSLDPMLVLVCVGHNRNSYPLMKENGRFTINILSESQQPLAENYAKPPEQRDAAFDNGFKVTERGSAVAEDCLAYMGCHVVQEHTAGDHSVFIGEVDEIMVNDGQPLLFFEGAFGRLLNNGKE